MRESAIERHLTQRVRSLGGMCVKLAPTTAGIPDRMVLLPGQPILLVELKAPGGRLSAIQVEIHDRLRKLGHPVKVLWSKAEVDLWLEFR